MTVFSWLIASGSLEPLTFLYLEDQHNQDSVILFISGMDVKVHQSWGKMEKTEQFWNAFMSSSEG